jgi:hypothetical protein
MITLLDVISELNRDYRGDPCFSALLGKVDTATRQRLEVAYRRWLFRVLEQEHERTLERED